MTAAEFVNYQLENVSLMPLKELATDKLSSDSFLRKLILSQPDEMPRWIAIGKCLAFSELMEMERGA
jgi:hypothetical protein